MAQGTSLTSVSAHNSFTHNSELDEEDFLLTEDGSQVLNATTTLLHATAVNGNKRLLQKLLQEAGDNTDEINKGDQFGRTPLVYSVLGDRLDCAKLLILHGASVSMGDVDGRTPLHWAAYQGSHKCVKLLLSKGADWKAKDTKGRTPLHFAASHQLSKCLSVLLKKAPKGEVQVDDPDNDSMTALHWGASYGNAEHVKMLLKARASVKLLDVEKKTPLHWGTTNQNPSVVKLILEQTVEIINWQDIEGRTAIHHAVARQNEAVVKTLLAVEECNPSVQDNMNRTPLHWAAVLGNSRIVKLLLRRDADYSLTDGNGATPLHYAAQGDYAKTVEVLLSFRNIKDIPDTNGRTALMWAAGKGASSSLETMLNHNLDIHDTDHSGRTALHVAAYAGDIKCVEILLHHGASVNTCDELNHTPIFRACEMGFADVVNVLKRNKAILDLEDQDGRSPLHWAALNGHAHICLTLVTNGVQANSGDRIGCTPLHCASYGGFVNCMTVLIDNGADVNKLDNEGISPLHWSCTSGHLEAVKLLLKKGAFPNFKKLDGERLTPLDYAILGDHQDVAQYMIEQGGLTINAIQDVAATTIQSCWRGYRVRKPFQKRKTLYMRHEQLKRDMKRKASAFREEEFKEKQQMMEATNLATVVPEISGWDECAQRQAKLPFSRRPALFHRTSGTDGGYFKLDLSLDAVRTGSHNSEDYEVLSEVSIDERYEESLYSNDGRSLFGGEVDDDENEDPLELSTILESYPQEDNELFSSNATGSGLEDLLQNRDVVERRNSDNCTVEMTSDMKYNVENNPKDPAENPNTKSSEDLKTSIYRMLQKKTESSGSNVNVLGSGESSLAASNRPANITMSSHSLENNCVLTNTVALTPIDGCEDNLSRVRREVVVQTKFDYARRDKERRNLIRAKMEAATVIQRWYRRYLRHKRTTQDTLVEGLQDQEELVKQVAALTIQLCWRKYLRNELRRARQRLPIRNTRTYENSHFRESNKIMSKDFKSRNKMFHGRSSGNSGTRRSRSYSKAAPTSTRHRKTATTSTVGSSTTVMNLCGTVTVKRDIPNGVSSKRTASNKVRPSADTTLSRRRSLKDGRKN